MIENHKKKVLNAIAVLEKRNFPEIDELLNSVGACYDKATSLLDDYFDEHSVLTLINDTWNSDLPEDFLDELQNNQQVMAPLELSEIYGICDDGEKRYKKENPPGYKDAKKKDGIRKYSDLIWWKNQSHPLLHPVCPVSRTHFPDQVGSFFQNSVSSSVTFSIVHLLQSDHSRGNIFL